VCVCVCVCVCECLYVRAAVKLETVVPVSGDCHFPLLLLMTRIDVKRTVSCIRGA
jgi:hypothetical protein